MVELQLWILFIKVIWFVVLSQYHCCSLYAGHQNICLLLFKSFRVFRRLDLNLSCFVFNRAYNWLESAITFKQNAYRQIKWKLLSLSWYRCYSNSIITKHNNAVRTAIQLWNKSESKDKFQRNLSQSYVAGPLRRSNFRDGSEYWPWALLHLPKNTVSLQESKEKMRFGTTKHIKICSRIKD